MSRKRQKEDRRSVVERMSPELEKETQKWYKRLEREGFKDIEKGKYTRSGDYTTLDGLYSLEAVPVVGSGAHEADAKYERSQIIMCWLAHQPPSNQHKPKRKKRILELYAEGKGIYTISKILRREKSAKIGNSVYTIHYDVKKWMKEIIAWNYEHEEGLYRARKERRNEFADIVGLNDTRVEYDDGED